LGLLVLFGDGVVGVSPVEEQYFGGGGGGGFCRHGRQHLLVEVRRLWRCICVVLPVLLLIILVVVIAL